MTTPWGYRRLQVLVPPNHMLRAYIMHGNCTPEVSTEIGSLSMKFGDKDTAMGVWWFASPSTAKSQVESLYHPWLWSPRGLYRKLERLEL